MRRSDDNEGKGENDPVLVTARGIGSRAMFGGRTFLKGVSMFSPGLVEKSSANAGSLVGGG